MNPYGLPFFSTPGPLVDEDRFMFGVLVGVPRDTARWKAEVADPAACQMEETAKKIYGDTFDGEYYGSPKHTKCKKDGSHGTPASEKLPRRGSHHAETFGTGMGGGQEQPTAFFHTVLHRLLLFQLLSSEPFQRIAGFCNCASSHISFYKQD